MKAKTDCVKLQIHKDVFLKHKNPPKRNSYPLQRVILLSDKLGFACYSVSIFIFISELFRSLIF